MKGDAMGKKKIKVTVESEKRGLFGKRTVFEEKEIEVDRKTYNRLKNKKADREFDELLLYEEIIDEDWL